MIHGTLLLLNENVTLDRTPCGVEGNSTHQQSIMNQANLCFTDDNVNTKNINLHEFTNATSVGSFHPHIVLWFNK
jgi:hypothetical protein